MESRTVDTQVSDFVVVDVEARRCSFFSRRAWEFESSATKMKMKCRESAENRSRVALYSAVSSYITHQTLLFPSVAVVL